MDKVDALKAILAQLTGDEVSTITGETITDVLAQFPDAIQAALDAKADVPEETP